ncbi:MAG: S-layer homology domain-containing protein [Bacillaceae bacterium]|nr:S-layer homology domain-containing protein [Bacillaceae bacterium]
MGSRNLITMMTLLVFLLSGLFHNQVTAASPFLDIEDHWAKKEITSLYKKGIVKGMDEATFGPDLPLTRGQFITMLHRTLEIENQFEDVPPIEDYFSDVTLSVYYADKLYNLASLGIVDETGNFHGERHVTREVMAHYLRNAYEFKTGEKGVTKEQTGDFPFTDGDQINPNYKEDVYYCYTHNLLNGYTDGTFGPKRTLTRAEGAVVIYRLKEAISSEPENSVDFKELEVKSGQELDMIYQAELAEEGVKVTFSYTLPSPAYFGKIESVTLNGDTLNIQVAIKRLDDDKLYPQVITTEQRTILVKVSEISTIRIEKTDGTLIKELSVSSR